MVDREIKARENRARRAAERQGYKLVKSARRDPRVNDYGRWWLVDVETTALVVGDRWGALLSEVEEWLDRPLSEGPQ